MDFIDAWKAFARWIASQEGAIGPVRLFKDNLDPAHYVSIDSWVNASARDSLQAGVQFGRQYYKLEQLAMDSSSRSFRLEAEEGLEVVRQDDPTPAAPPDR